MLTPHKMDSNQFNAGDYDLRHALEDYSDAMILDSAIDPIWGTAPKEGARQRLLDRLRLDVETKRYYLAVRQVEDGATVTKLLPVAEAVKLLLSPQNPELEVARLAAQKEADRKAVLRNAKDAAEEATRRERAWQALPASARAALQLAQEQRSPELAQLLHELALAIQSETTKPSQPPDGWGVEAN